MVQTPNLGGVKKGLKKAIDQWSAAYAVEQPPEEPDTETESSENAPDQGGVSSSTTRPALASDGISFDVPKGRKLSERIRRSLKKIHYNLGHPAKADLIRFLKLGGVTVEVLETVEWIKCLICEHAKHPKTHRIASIPLLQVVFGDEVQLDCFKIHDASGISY